MIIRWWKNSRNRIDYNIRQLLRWRRPFQPLPAAPSTNNLPAQGIMEFSDRAMTIADRLISTYHFDEYEHQTSAGNFRENLFYIHMLETACFQGKINLTDPLVVFDIGTSHWFYAHGLSAFLTWYQAADPGRGLKVIGFENDPYRVYTDFHSRFDHALKNCAGLPGFEFIPHGFEPQPDQADLVTLFFPFIFEADHLDWGLPSSKFSPAKLIDSAWASLKSGGSMLIVNQGEAEHQTQIKILDEQHIPIKAKVKMDDVLFKYDLDRYLLVCGPHD